VGIFGKGVLCAKLRMEGVYLYGLGIEAVCVRPVRIEAVCVWWCWFLRLWLVLDFVLLFEIVFRAGVPSPMASR
jgi:uncharacterized membrane protein